MGLGEGGRRSFEGLIARKKSVKWALVVIDVGVGVVDLGISAGLFSEEGKGKVLGIWGAGRRACAVLWVEVKVVAALVSLEDSVSSLLLIMEKAVEAEETVLMLS